MTATLRFDVVSNGSGARRDLASTRREVDKFGSSTDRVGAASTRNQSKVKRFGGAVGGLAKRFGPLAAAAAAAGVVKFGVDAVKAASATQQAYGALDAVFGKNSAAVKRWSESAVNDVGLARGEYAQMSATLGAGLRNSGVDNYAAKTRGLIKIGADLAAQFGGSTAESVAALGSLLRGEADPIERYGVSIKQSDVNARLAALGQDKLTGAARKQAEMQARLSLVTQQTKTSQGAFRRESSTLAGQQQRLAANFTNVKDKLGQKLLPVMTRALGAVNRMFDGSGKLSGITRKLADIYGSYFRPIINAARGSIDKIRSSFSQAGGKGDGLRKIASALGKTAKFIAPLIGKTLGGAITKIASVAGTTLAAIDRLASGISSVVSWAQKAWDKIGALADKARSIGSLGGLLRTGDDRQRGLARAAGGGLVGSFSRSPAITLESRPSVVIDVDSPALARLFRVVVRDELRQLSRAGGAVT